MVCLGMIFNGTPTSGNGKFADATINPTGSETEERNKWIVVLCAGVDAVQLVVNK